MRPKWVNWVPIVAVACFLASGVLRWVLPEPLRDLRMAERVAASGLFLLLMWGWLAKWYAKRRGGKPAGVGWLGMVGLTLLVGPGLAWVIFSISPVASAPPDWLNWLTWLGYLPITVWGYYQIRWSHQAWKAAMTTLRNELGEKL